MVPFCLGITFVTLVQQMLLYDEQKNNNDGCIAVWFVFGQLCKQ